MSVYNGQRQVANPGVVCAIAAVGVAGIGAMIGLNFTPDAWFEALRKPFFQPPDWLFSPVWTVLYLMIGWVGGRKYLYGGAQKLWLLQLVLNFAWMPVFVGLHSVGGALALIVALWAILIAFLRIEWGSDRVSAYLFLPYFAWVTFATLLTLAIWILN